MKNKLSSNVILIVVIVILVGASIYLIMANQSAPNGQTTINQNTNVPQINTNQNTPPTNTPPTNTPPVNTPSTTTINYQNTQYNFNFTLPASWTGYSIVNTTWTGMKSGAQGETAAATGPIISIRNPLWTVAVPRQDIPIMVFTIKQWNSLQNDEFHIGAAPIGPSELDRNNTFVFALPARYNFAFPVGYEEVDTILQGKPLSAF